MASPLDKSLGLHVQALQVRAERSGLLASNIANADTPGYKSQDIDFRATLKRVSEGGVSSSVGMARTNDQHIESEGGAYSNDVMYRTPLSASLDGNTVDPHVEYAEFSENSVRYQASLQFLGGRFKSLSSAIRGEL